VIHAAYAHDRSSIVDATQNVIDAAQAVGAQLLYVSSDAVFSGDGLPRAENAPPDPVWDYGRWKSQAETIVLSRSPSAAIARLPLMVSLDPEDHVVERIRLSAARHEPTAWFDDEKRQPAFASEVADALWRIAMLDTPQRAGTWHLPGPERLSRYQIALRVVSVVKLDPTLVVPEPSPPAGGRPRDIWLRDARAMHVLGWSPSEVLI
jgi:dTDP-4-dehydrorhamnose reductase